MILLHDYLDYYARITPTHPFSSDSGHAQTYAEAAALTAGIVDMLSRSGITPGDRVAILSRNSDRFVPIICALSKMGAVAVPLNYRLAAVEIEFILHDAGVNMLFAQQAELDRLREQGWVPSGSCAVTPIEKLSSAIVADQADANAATTSGNPVLLQMYTSGTSGRPKGVLITQNALLTNAHQLEIAIPYRLNRKDRVLIVCPLYHAAAFISAVMTLRAGAEAVIQAAFDSEAVVTTLRKEGIAATTLVPAMIGRCVQASREPQQLGAGPLRFPALKHILYGASPISPDVLTNAVSLFGCAFTQAFGLTETTSAATALTAEDHVLALSDRPDLLRSCGRALIGTHIQAGDACASGIDEVRVSGPQVMQGYANLPAETSLADGWFGTGDLGACDADGYLTISDRLKDMIISGGENIYSIEVENALMSHPLVVEAAVIGVPDPALGEALMAFIVVTEAVPDADAIIAHCRSMLAGYKIPRRYEIIAALPRNASGKVLKNELRMSYGE